MSKNQKSNERSFNNLQKRSFPPNLEEIRAQIRFNPHDPILTPFYPHLTTLGVTFPKSDFESFHVEQKSLSGANFIKIAQWEYKNYDLVELLKSKNGSPLPMI